MKTPLFDAIEHYKKQNKSRFHTPGHGGISHGLFGDVLAYDVTEIPGLDSLYEASGAIAKSEERYAALYGAKASLYSAGGSTLCIQAMLALIAKPRGKVVVNRGAHTSVVNAMALLDLEPVWIWPEQDLRTGLSKRITAEQVTQAVCGQINLCGVFITSPDYYGQNAEIAEISAVCKAHKLPLLVDGAHGAHYPFLEQTSHPNQLGADLCCNSLHKTLPALSGAAMLHVNNEAYLADAKQRMSLFGSTSPSYLILLSMDILLPPLEQEGKDQWKQVVDALIPLRNIAEEGGYLIPSGNVDPIRLTLGFGGAGYRAEEFAHLLTRHAIEAEYMDDYYAVFLPSILANPRDWQRLEQMLREQSHHPPREINSNSMLPPPQKMSLRQAMFSSRKVVPLTSALGQIAGAVVSPCPPGIPLLVPGEEITESTVECLERCGIFRVTVI